MNGLCEMLRLQTGLVLQEFQHHTLLMGELMFLTHMLQATTAADAEMRTARLDALWARFEHGDGIGLVKRGSAALNARQHAFTGQGAMYENCFAIYPAYAATFVG